MEKYTNTGQGMSASTDQLGVTRASIVNSVFASSDDLEGREEKNEAEPQRRQRGGRDNAIYKHLTGFSWTLLKA